MTCEHCEELEEEVRQLKAELFGADWTPPDEFRLTPSEAVIVRALIKKVGACSREFLMNATRGAPGTLRRDVNMNVIDAQISYIRQKFRPYDLTIGTVWGTGYCISNQTRQRLLNWPTQHTEAA